MNLISLPDGRIETTIQKNVDRLLDTIKIAEKGGPRQKELAEELLEGIQERTELVEDFRDLHECIEEMRDHAEELGMQPLVTALLAMGVLVRQALINIHPIYWREDVMFYPAEGDKK